MRRTAFLGVLMALAVYAVALSSLHFLRDGWKPHRVETAWLLFGAAALLAVAMRAATRTERDVPDASRSARSPLLALVPASVALIAYAPVPGVGLLSDDFVLLALSPQSTGWAGFFRPVPVTLFWLANGSAGEAAAPLLHGVSLALHVLNGGLVLLIARRLGLDSRAGTLACGLFLLFPASVEAIAWIAALQDVIAVSAGLTFLAVALGTRSMAPGLLAFAVAILSKESAVVIPFVAAALLVARDGEIVRSRRFGLVVTGVAAAVFAVWRLQIADNYLAIAPSRYVFKNLASMTFGTLAVPWTTPEVRAWPVLGVLAALLVAAAALAAATSGRPKSARLNLALVAWVALSVAPAYTWLFIGDWLEGGRHLYLAIAGWALVLCAVATMLPPAPRRYLTTALVVLAAAWALSIPGHVNAWRRAADERDRILAASEMFRSTSCEAYTVESLTDNVDGAYVFRNGFDAALRRRGIESPAAHAAPECRFGWDGERFVPLHAR